MERRLSVLTKKSRIRSYELLFIINPELGEEESETLLARVWGYLEQAGGVVYSFKSWGIRRLAYTLKGCKEGHYHLVQFTMPTENVAGFRRSLLLAEGVLREIVTLADEEFAGEPLAEKAAASEAPVEAAPVEATSLEATPVEEASNEDTADAEESTEETAEA